MSGSATRAISRRPTSTHRMPGIPSISAADAGLRLRVVGAQEDVAVDLAVEGLEALGRDRVEAGDDPRAVAEDRLGLLGGRAVPGAKHLPRPAADGGREGAGGVEDHGAGGDGVLDRAVDLGLARVRDGDRHDAIAPGARRPRSRCRCPPTAMPASSDGLRSGLGAPPGVPRADRHVMAGPRPSRSARPKPSAPVPPITATSTARSLVASTWAGTRRTRGGARRTPHPASRADAAPLASAGGGSPCRARPPPRRRAPRPRPP